MPRRKKIEDDFILTEEEKSKSKKIIIKNIFLTKPKVSGRNESQRNLIRSIKDNEITICTGIAGSGKTFVSLAYALSLLYDQKNNYNKIYLVKSVTTLKNEEIGFLKGDLREKFDPFMWSFKINMEKVLEESEIKTLFGLEIVRPFPLAYIKGSSLDNALIIADEIQNVLMDNCRVLMTRIGSNSKLILIGDSNQIDLKDKNQSCLEPLMNMFDNINEIGTIRMSDKDDNCRNPLIKIIEDKFKSYFDESTVKNIEKLHKDYGNGNNKQQLHS